MDFIASILTGLSIITVNHVYNVIYCTYVIFAAINNVIAILCAMIFSIFDVGI